jgi:predicted dehydrogenase
MDADAGTDTNPDAIEVSPQEQFTINDLPIRVGVVGCGLISQIYLRNCELLPAVQVVACADLLRERAEEAARTFGVPRVCSVDELVADDEVEAVLNLTIPAAHAELNLRALEAGKHIYSEKPLAITREDGQRILALAAERGLRVGCAPDTFLGGALQTCRRLLDEGTIGEPFACAATMVAYGVEHWHPNPDFLFQPGAGPLFDMGPYYLTALISLLGPIERVTGSARITYPERTITSQPLAGTTITVRTPTHVAGVMDFAGGSVGTLLTSFDVRSRTQPYIEIYGDEGTMSVPDPNQFGGTIALQLGTRRALRHRTIEVREALHDNWRGIGLADMARAIRSGGEPRASGALAYHVLDAMHAILESSEQERHVHLESRCARPEPYLG